MFEKIAGDRTGGFRGREVGPALGLNECGRAMVNPATAVGTFLLCQAGLQAIPVIDVMEPQRCRIPEGNISGIAHNLDIYDIQIRQLQLDGFGLTAG
ncbi:hypothetical protein [Ruegeria sp. Alg231-54]|uniref:hypothetical protein n=1 Tax=Ruegeria sp. Alg231-54 TaxID=1922221 RepID=UPI00131ED7A0|nr:hypothetical protein [Ruegeria sp. Alg231-54]